MYHSPIGSFEQFRTSSFKTEHIRFDSPNCGQSRISSLVRGEGDDTLFRAERRQVTSHRARFAEDDDQSRAQFGGGIYSGFGNGPSFSPRLPPVDQFARAI